MPDLYTRSVSRTSRFDAAQRRSAVVRAFESGDGPDVVARELGVHPATVYRWAGELSATRPGHAAGQAADQLVRAAQDLLLQHDYDTLTMKTLAARAEMSLRSAYHHFASKEALFSAAVDDAATSLVDAIGDAAPTTLGDQPLRQLRELVLTAADRVYDLPCAHVLFRDSGLPPHVLSSHRWHALFVDVVERHLHHAQRLGQLEDTEDTGQLATALVGAVRGVHAAVFDGLDPQTARLLIGRLMESLRP